MVRSYNRVKIWYICACSNLYSQLNFKKIKVIFSWNLLITPTTPQPPPTMISLRLNKAVNLQKITPAGALIWSILIFFHFKRSFFSLFFRRGSPLYAHLWIFDGPNSNKWTFTVIRGQAGQLPKRHSNHWCVMTEVQKSTNVFKKLRWNLSWY